ncbi:hypothetical protein CA13_65970 [Planctomycetes bacterium CA13]|uniref:Uncharacterized protein n=1 Tax=Novipirellula herctigrandis TaxID=2527986 RepID=A0A5C5ZD77_9BACT|nr:hypothetical protein CA13_65970 [Planctomycetes bacterium CA13]
MRRIHRVNGHKLAILLIVANLYRSTPRRSHSIAPIRLGQNDATLHVDLKTLSGFAS